MVSINPGRRSGTSTKRITSEGKGQIPGPLGGCRPRPVFRQGQGLQAQLQLPHVDSLDFGFSVGPVRLRHSHLRASPSRGRRISCTYTRMHSTVSKTEWAAVKTQWEHGSKQWAVCGEDSLLYRCVWDRWRLYRPVLVLWEVLPPMDGSNRVLFLGPLFLLSPPTLGLLPLRNDVQVLWKEPQSGCVTQFQRGGGRREGEGGRIWFHFYYKKSSVCINTYTWRRCERLHKLVPSILHGKGKGIWKGRFFLILKINLF